MSRNPLKTFAVLAGLILLAGLAVMTLQTGQIEAASPPGSAPMFSTEPGLDVRTSAAIPPGGQPESPTQGNNIAWEITFGIRQNTRLGNDIQNVFQPLNEGSLTITQLEESVSFYPDCGFLPGVSGKLMKCELRPGTLLSDVWEEFGDLRFILRVATTDGDTAERLLYLGIQYNPCAAPNPPPHCPQCQGNPLAECQQCNDAAEVRAPDCPQCNDGAVTRASNCEQCTGDHPWPGNCEQCAGPSPWDPHCQQCVEGPVEGCENY